MTKGCLAVLAAALLVVSGCGDDKDEPRDVTFAGNISQIIPPQSSSAAPTSHHWFARLESLVLPEAVAQANCSAQHTLICVTDGRDPAPVCAPVDGDNCQFFVGIDIPENEFTGLLSFVDDANGNGDPDEGEATTSLTANIGTICRGMHVVIRNVIVSFPTSTATASSVEKNPATCPAPAPTPTSPPLPTPTPNQYAMVVPLNPAPSRMLAIAYGFGAVALLLPVRRRKRR